MTCNLCPNFCGVERDKSYGMCLADDKIHISYHGIHEWEEPVISGKKGSGAIFFSGCTMRCVFCQNAKISRRVTGKVYSPEELSELFKYFDEVADNINLVSATQYTDEIIKAFSYYTPKNPVIWNTSGFETVETVQKLAPFINVWLPDLKYVNRALSLRLSGKKDYFKYAFSAISEMIKLSGKVKIEDGLIKSGVIVRHLIIPSHVDNTLDVLKVFADNFKNNAYLSLMAQYVPLNVENFPDINRRITPLEYKRALKALETLNIENGFVQDLESATTAFIPDF